MKASQSVADSLAAFQILTSDYLKKVYDLGLDNGDWYPKHEDLLGRTVKKSSKTNSSLDLQSVFSERRFLVQMISKVLMRVFGIHFLYPGFGTYNSKTQKLEPVPLKFNQAAFIMHLAFYFGIPIGLGFIRPILWLSLLPVLSIKFFSEYWKAKFEYYTTELKF